MGGVGRGKVVILGANVQSKGRKGVCIFMFHKLLAKIVPVLHCLCKEGKLAIFHVRDFGGLRKIPG